MSTKVDFGNERVNLFMVNLFMVRIRETGHLKALCAVLSLYVCLVFSGKMHPSW